MSARRAAVLTILALVSTPAIRAQAPPDPPPRIAAQKEALAKLAFLDGSWRGEATYTGASGKQTVTQTERVGPFLGGSVRLIEGRGYDNDGGIAFNAFGVMSYDPDRKTYSMRTYSQGRAADVAVTLTADGFAWQIEVGPLTIRYTATVKDGTWHEVGDRITVGGTSTRFFEMTLKRIGDTEWPEAGAVSPRQ